MRSAPPESDAHRLRVEALLGSLGTTPAGLTNEEAASRLATAGPNELPPHERMPHLLLFGRQLFNRFALLLWVGAALAFVARHFDKGEGLELIGAALIVVVVLNGSFSYWQQLRVERAMAAFRAMLSIHARVFRHGNETEVEARDVVPGDILVLREGDRVSADARLLDVHGLKVDNSPLTGESEPQLRSTSVSTTSLLASRNVVFSGTTVTAGAGRAVVFATGPRTQIGRIADVVRTTKRVETPMQREIRHFVRTISGIALGVGIFFFILGTAIGNPFWTNVIFAIGIIVANVPEGLLPTVTLALAIAGRKMARRKALIKSLESAETLGSTTIICTDKTGTLTIDEMRVTDVLMGADAPANPAAQSWAHRVMALCNNARIESGPGEAQVHGDPTERALLLHVEDVGEGGVGRLRRECPRLHERPFERTTRDMVTVNDIDGELWALLKGAPEAVLGRCSAVLDREGMRPLERRDADDILERANEHARTGKRVLALARRPLPHGADLDVEAESGTFEFLGLVVMHDPPRPEVSRSIERCRSAGIRVFVISGDHPLTVGAIAREVGISRSAAPQVLTGAELASMDDAQLSTLLAESTELCFARTSPLDKLRIVRLLQTHGEIVAVTGDGVNDAPALKRADIGIAMGRSGSDVAREAADMVLMDDDFSTIVAAIEEGRAVYTNIRRFVGYVLTSNVPEILPYVAFVLFAIPLPLPVLLILAVDLGTDMVPAIALANEPPERDVMQRPPRSPRERLLTPTLLFTAYGVLGLVEAAAGFAAYGWVLHDGGWRPGIELSASDPIYRQAIAAFFVAIVICQIANVMVWRTSHDSVLTKGLFRNRAILLGIAVELVLTLLIVYSEPGTRWFGTSGLPPMAWLIPLPFALLMMAGSELVKYLIRGRQGAHAPAPRSAASVLGQ